MTKILLTPTRPWTLFRVTFRDSSRLALEAADGHEARRMAIAAAIAAGSRGDAVRVHRVEQVEVRQVL